MAANDEKHIKTTNVYNQWGSHGGGNAVYGLGLVGALIYYLQHADSFGLALLGILKALVWPGFVVYDLMKFLHM